MITNNSIIIVVSKKNPVTKKTSKTEISIDFSDIYYIESCKNYVYIVTKIDNYKMRATIKNLTLQLKPYGFVKIHSAFIVSLGKIKCVNKNEITLIDGTKLYASRNNMPYVKNALNTYKSAKDYAMK